MKLHKKYIKNLSRDKKALPLNQTHHIAGGTTFCTTDLVIKSAQNQCPSDDCDMDWPIN